MTDGTSSTAAPNADQVAYWNGDAGDKWARLQARLDGLFVPISAAAVAAAAPCQGEHALDIGCGCGATVLALAEGVGPLGRVTGVDISAPMLAVAEHRIAASALTQAAVLKADAATEPFAPGSFDLAFSRFGVMFFDAPVEAFINIHRALKPGGRLVFACWRPFKTNPWFSVPYRAAVPHLPEQERPEPEAPGPFAFADPRPGRADPRPGGLRGGAGRGLRRAADLGPARRGRRGDALHRSGRPRVAGAGERHGSAACGRRARGRGGAGGGRRAGGHPARRPVLVRLGAGLSLLLRRGRRPAHRHRMKRDRSAFLARSPTLVFT